MSRGSPPAIFHSRLACTPHCKSIFLSPVTLLTLSHSLFPHPPSSPPFVSRAYSRSLTPPSSTVAPAPPWYNSSRSLSVARLYRRSRFGRWCNKRKRTAASIMRATLSQRDQQRLNCIRDSRTAHKFSSLRRGFLLNTRPSAVIRRVFSFHPIFLASLYPSHDFTGYFRNATVVHVLSFIKAVVRE